MLRTSDDFVVSIVLKKYYLEVDDEYGNSPALQLVDSTLLLFPMTMISKRVEAGEIVDIYEMYGGLLKTIDEIKRKMD